MLHKGSIEIPRRLSNPKTCAKCYTVNTAPEVIFYRTELTNLQKLVLLVPMSKPSIAASWETKRIKAMYDYLVAPATWVLPSSIDVGFVFCRESKHLVTATIKMARRCVDLVLDGNIGKDSGSLPERGVSEADFVADGVLAANAISPDRIKRGYKSKNGLDNAVNGIHIIQNELQLPGVDELVTASHPVQSRRLGGTFVHQAGRLGLNIGNVTHLATDYTFDPTNPFDQFEAAGEMLRVNNLSAKGDESWLARPDDLDQEMVTFAQELNDFHQAQFDLHQPRIVNPSTADNTNHYVLHVLRNAG